MERRAGAAPGGCKTSDRRPERLGLRSSAPQERGVVRGASRSRSRVRLAARRPWRSQARHGSSTSVDSTRRRPELRRVARASRAHRGRARPALPSYGTFTCGPSRAPVSFHHSHSQCDARVSSCVHGKSRAERPFVMCRRVAAGARLPSSLVCCNGVHWCHPASRCVSRGASAERSGRSEACHNGRTA